MSAIVSGVRRIDRAELMDRAQRAAAGLRDLGVRPGDLVALVLRNDFAFLEASFAAERLGAYSTPINWHSTEEEARYLFADAQPKAIVIHADLVGQLRGALPPGVQVLVVDTPPEIQAAYGASDSSCRAGHDTLSWEGWLQRFKPADGDPPPAPGAIVYTSGTTGRPKGVRRHVPTVEQSLLNQRFLRRAFGYGNEDPASIVTLVAGPMYHSAPNAHGLFGVRLGATTILMPRFDPEEFLRLVEAHRITHLHLVPVMFNRLLRLPPEVRSRYDLSSLRFAVHAAAPCPQALKREMMAWWGPIIHEYYGSTETGLVTMCDAHEWLERPGTVGRAVPEAMLAVLGDDGRRLDPGQVGSIAARTPGLPDFTYHRDDQKRAAAERAGMILTGDIGFVDEQGYLFLSDRSADVIISGGVNIYSAEIEAEIMGIDAVSDCCVFGVPDDEYGEAVFAAIQLVPGCNVAAAEIQARLRKRLSGFKVPRRVEFYPELPREESGKIFKRKLRDAFWAGRDRRI
jgi:long-chain acyl-CoA synthetase